MSQTIFVAGATGQQGSAVIGTLLSSPSSSNITVHGLTRDPSSASAKALLTSHRNVKLFQGSFDDIPSITKAATDCTCAFLNVTPVIRGSESDSTGEAQHARNLVEACSNVSSIKRIVFSSTTTMHSPRLTEIFDDFIPKHPNSWPADYMTSKKACEDAIINSHFPEGWVILRGVMFFSNFLKPFSAFMYPDLEIDQTIKTVFNEDFKISLVDPVDVGALAARMLVSTPEEWTKTWKGKFVPLASENLTMTELVAVMNEVLAERGVGKQIKLVHLSKKEAKEQTGLGSVIVDSHLFVNEYSPAVDLDEVRSFGIDVNGLTKAKAFFARDLERLIETVGGA